MLSPIKNFPDSIFLITALLPHENIYEIVKKKKLKY